MKNKYLISKCLLGIPCRYDGKSIVEKDTNVFNALIESGSIAACPEELGGLPTPRLPSEIQGESGEDVIDGISKIINTDGMDVSKEFKTGALKTLEIIQKNNISCAILKSRSPSCGKALIYDGSFSGKLKTGNGITTALLKRNNIRVISDEEFLK